MRVGIPGSARHDGMVAEVVRLLREAAFRIETDRYMTIRKAAVYTEISEKKLRKLLPPSLQFRPSPRKLLVRRSELDQWMESYRESRCDLGKLADEVLGKVLRGES